MTTRVLDYGFGHDHWDGAPPGMTPQGVRFNEELANADGMRFTLCLQPGQDADRARRWLRNTRDVVGRIAIEDPMVPWGWQRWYDQRGLDPDSFVVTEG